MKIDELLNSSRQFDELTAGAWVETLKRKETVGKKSREAVTSLKTRLSELEAVRGEAVNDARLAGKPVPPLPKEIETIKSEIEDLERSEASGPAILAKHEARILLDLVPQRGALATKAGEFCDEQKRVALEAAEIAVRNLALVIGGIEADDLCRKWSTGNGTALSKILSEFGEAKDVRGIRSTARRLHERLSAWKESSNGRV